MSEKLSELSSSKIAFRIAVFAAALAILGRFPSGLEQFFGIVLLVAAAALFYEAWLRRWSQRRLRRNLSWGTLSLAGALLLLSGWMAMAATPLLAMAAVCGALGGVAMLSERS